MNLKSRSEGEQERSEIMDFIDIDQVLDVPDTPDRLVTAVAHSSHHNGTEKQNDASKNSRVVSKDYINGSMINQARENRKSVTVNGNRRLSIPPEFGSNSLVSQSESLCTLKNAKPMVDTTRRDKGKALCNSNFQRSTCKEGGSLSDLSEQNGHGHSGISRVNASRKGVLSLNSSPAIDSLDRSSKLCKSNNTLKIGPIFDHGKGVDIIVGAHHEAKSNASIFMQPCTSSRAPRQKRLVRNGCISPLNIAKSKHVAEKHEIGSMAKEGCSGSGTMASDGQPTTVDIKDLIAEAKDSCRCKGKGVSHHPSSEEPDARNGHMSHRILKQPADGSCDFILDASKCFAETEGWRTTHNRTKERDAGRQKNGMLQKDHRNERDIQHLDEMVSSECVYDAPQTVSHRAHKLGTKRQRDGGFSSHFIDDSAGETSTLRSKRNKNVHRVGTSNPVSEPNTRLSNNEDSSVRALQVEADEMLARQLQEQFYNEEQAPASGTDEMDSHLALAMALHLDNSSRHAGGRHANRRRGPPISSGRQYSRSINSRRPSIRGGLQPQARTSSRLDRLRDRFFPRPRRISSASTPRNSIFPPNMDVDMRMEILETLEAVGDMQVPNDLLQVGREFNENDYEMLLSLDEDNHRHGGATRAQINNLPESTVQAENLQECTICLETPTIGETIRHLPCLHRFHKECIDRWLRRKTSCPVCKSSIT